MIVWQIINYILIYTWLFLVLWLLWRHALGGSTHVHRLHLLLNENMQKSIEAANKSAEAAHMAAQTAQKMAALLEKKMNEDA